MSDRTRSRISRDTVETVVFRTLRVAVIVFLLVITVFPFYYMVLLSVRTLGDVLRDPGALWADLGKITFSTYERVISPVAGGGEGFLAFVLNSLVLATVTAIVTLAVAIPGSYAVSRLSFFGRRQVGALFLAIYLFPSILLAVPLFVFFTRIEMNGSMVPVLIVYVALTVAVSIYMLRNYFDTIPLSLEEAAAIDGCGRAGIIWRISLPLAMPAIVANALYVFMIAWNEFLFALLFLVRDRQQWTVSLGLSQLTGSSIEVPATVLMAASVITTIPIVIIFFFSQRLLVEGLTTGGEKS